MRWMKPIVIDLQSGASACGQESPDSCISGNAASSGFGFCQLGNSPSSNLGNECGVGPAPGLATPPVCFSGAAPGIPACNAGTDGFNFGDTCTSGPAPA